MALPLLLILLLIAISLALVAVFVFLPRVTATEGGKILSFFAFFCLPIICGAIGVSREMHVAESREFCLSCHVMEPFGQSLRVDDPGHLAAAHFQNHRVPPDQACYTCHTNYAMFGGLQAKMDGLRHVYVYYLTSPPAPSEIRLRRPYDNRECLHCHLGARSFEEGVVHKSDPSLMAAIKSNQMSCISSGCHSVVHDVATLNEQKFWKEPQ
jgi:cytochrome c-type protein NapC